MRWQPDGVAIHAEKWFLGAPPISLRLGILPPDEELIVILCVMYHVLHILTMIYALYVLCITYDNNGIMIITCNEAFLQRAERHVPRVGRMMADRCYTVLTLYVCMCVYIYIHIRVYVYIYIYSNDNSNDDDTTDDTNTYIDTSTNEAEPYQSDGADFLRQRVVTYVETILYEDIL